MSKNKTHCDLTEKKWLFWSIAYCIKCNKWNNSRNTEFYRKRMSQWYKRQMISLCISEHSLSCPCLLCNLGADAAGGSMWLHRWMLIDGHDQTSSYQIITVYQTRPIACTLIKTPHNKCGVAWHWRMSRVWDAKWWCWRWLCNWVLT